jgi:small subunit ribosomal protein S3
MGQKIHPTAFRLSIARNWNSRWYASPRKFPIMLAEDLKVREFLKSRLKGAAVSRVLIERPAKNARITIYSARPGVVIGKKGEDIEVLKVELAKLLGVPVAVNIEEIRKPEIGAQLVADSITQQLEKRIMFRRAMKRAMQNAMRLGAKGIKIMSSGRLNGIEIARKEWYREGRVPLHTLKADIDYGFSEARTAYGVIGVKCWIYKGDRDQQQGSHQSEQGFDASETDDAKRGRRRHSPSRPGSSVPPLGASTGAAADGASAAPQPKRVRRSPAPTTAVAGSEKNKGI